MNNFIVSIAEQDSEHYQLLTRIVLRLNNGEAAHQELMSVLFKIRSLLADVQVRMGRGEYDNRVQFAGMEHELQFGTVYAKIILREEWQKLKREVADPEQLIKDIRATSLPDAAAVEELARKIAPSVASPLSAIPTRSIAPREPVPAAPAPDGSTSKFRCPQYPLLKYRNVGAPQYRCGEVRCFGADMTSAW
ncbi:hypothetical protein Q8F57_009780 [Paraburkholderia terrae]|uniref:hypothetical protein n=1 Tax=Paraburkholderia terrae TaxID=311230 RepID=UPI00296B2EB3|nr:hypothetical protein [Paraburkholderia terrae]MDW3663956.1 hypothetical protein [Paraburkholderia terrae]